MCVCAFDRKCNNNHNLAWLSVFLPQSFNFHVTVWAKYILYLYFSYALLMIRNEFVENIASIAMMARVDSQTNLGESNLRHGNTDRKQIVISFSPNYNCKLVCETWISKLTFFFYCSVTWHLLWFILWRMALHIDTLRISNKHMQCSMDSATEWEMIKIQSEHHR